VAEATAAEMNAVEQKVVTSVDVANDDDHEDDDTDIKAVNSVPPKDQNNAPKHDRGGVLAMASSSKNDIFDDEYVTALPPPRTFSKAPPVVFTPRAFPTPLRESRAKEEDDWLAKNYSKIKEMRDAGKPSGPVSFMEKDATWLRSKADDFARVGDWDSACNAFTAAIEAGQPDAALLLNRASCHLRRYRAVRCAEDCTAALDVLLRMHGDSDAGVGDRVRVLRASNNEKAVALVLKALSRRLSAMALQGKFSSALSDALVCCEVTGEESETGGHFAACCERLASLSAVESIKLAADASVQQGDVDKARSLYADALNAEPSYAVCLLNRAALYLNQGLFSECVGDCDRVMSLLNAEHSSSGPEDPIHIVPLPGSELSSACRVRATARREEAIRNMKSA
jgi:tetratricopeptide (TPR) repeat protein